MHVPFLLGWWTFSSPNLWRMLIGCNESWDEDHEGIYTGCSNPDCSDPLHSGQSQDHSDFGIAADIRYVKFG